MTPKTAIVREPGASYSKCISSHPMRHTIDLGKARKQHSVYCSTLSELGLEILRLPKDDAHPDSCFVEDNAVVHNRRALICRMAEESRRGEESDVERVLAERLEVQRAAAPATIEGGDVIHQEDRLICGLTRRTNRAGVAQMISWLGVRVDTIADDGIVHLKSYVNHLGNGLVITTRKYASHHSLRRNKVLIVPDDEWYGTNNIVIGKTAVMPKGYPSAKELIQGAGFDVIELEMTEFPKCEGALTCLSILL
jgi:dimethylargininase